jgi:hypothetical protein
MRSTALQDNARNATAYCVLVIEQPSGVTTRAELWTLGPETSKSPLERTVGIL